MKDTLTPAVAFDRHGTPLIPGDAVSVEGVPYTVDEQSLPGVVHALSPDGEGHEFATSEVTFDDGLPVLGIRINVLVADWVEAHVDPACELHVAVRDAQRPARGRPFNIGLTRMAAVALRHQAIAMLTDASFRSPAGNVEAQAARRVLTQLAWAPA